LNHVEVIILEDFFGKSIFFSFYGEKIAPGYKIGQKGRGTIIK